MILCTSSSELGIDSKSKEQKSFVEETAVAYQDI